MTAFVLGRVSLQRLEGVHPDLVRVVQRAIRVSPLDFVVVEGLRTQDRQRQLVASGASKTMNSRHLTGHAVDLAPYVAGEVRWDWGLFYTLASAMRLAASLEQVTVRWGGAWKELHTLPEKITSADLSRSFPDGPHFELPRRLYP